MNRRKKILLDWWLDRGATVSNLSVSESGGVFTASFNYSVTNSIPPTGSGVDIVGVKEVGETVTISKTYTSETNTPEGNSVYELWAGGSKNTFSLIDSNTTGSFLLGASADGKFLKAVYWAKDENGVTAEFPEESPTYEVIGLNSYFDARWDVVDSNFWQDLAKTTAAGAGDPVKAIDDIIGSVTLETASGQTDATLENGYLDMTKDPVSGFADRGYIGDTNISDAQPTELFIVITPKTGGDTGYLFKGNGPNIRAVSPNWTIDSGASDTVSEGANDTKAIFHLTINGASSEWRVNNGAPTSISIGAFATARVTIGDDTQTMYHHWHGTYIKFDLFANATERNEAYALIADKHGL